MRGKLIYVTSSFPFGKGESFIHPEVKAWIRREVDISIIPVYPRGDLIKQCEDVSYFCGPLINFSYFLSFIKLCLTRPIVVFRIMRFLTGSPSKFFKNLGVFPKAAFYSLKLSDQRVFHIHAHWGGVSSTFAYMLSELTGAPWSITCHRWDIYENNLLEVKSKSANFVRFISKKGQVDAVKLGVPATKSVVIGMGVENVSRSVNALVCSKPKIVCAANMLPVKGHRYLIGAAAIMKQFGIDFSVDFYGEGESLESLKYFAREKKVSDIVHFKGYLPHSSLLNMYSKGDVHIFVLPSIDLGEGLHEGVPVALMEAMSYGIPVVSTKTGSIGELIPDSLGLTVDAADSEQLAEVIMRLINDHDFYKKSSDALFSIISDAWLVEDSVAKMHHLL
jgi:glycosyltransferase involved in cell wall biosynthesis